MNEVIVYTSPTCGYCKLTKDFLNENGVKFIEKNISSDANASSDFQKLGAKGVPVIVYGKEIIYGYDKNRLDTLFGKLIIECPKCRAKLRLPRNKGVLEVTCNKCSHAFRVNSNK